MQSNSNEIVRAHIWVRGRVQGVGFRAHVEYAASRIGGLSGWVRNVGWDMVEAVAEGEATQVALLIEAMKQGPSMSRVDECRVEYEAASGEFGEFTVKSSR